jgi:flagellar biosynthetic protein FliR
METLAELADLGSVAIWQFALAFFRVGAFVSLLPGFGERSVPVRIKLVCAVAFAAIVAPVVPVSDPPGSTIALFWIVAVETIIGLAFGIGVRLFLLALQVAGTIAAQSTSLSQIFGGATVEPSPAMGSVLIVAGLALVAMLDLHTRAAALLIMTYDLFPPGQLPLRETLTSWGVQRTASAFALAFSLSAPFFIAATLYNLALGAINRAMPQLMVAFVGAPFITLAGLALMCISAPLLLSVWADALLGFMADPGGAP